MKFANVISLIALFVALGGTSYAVATGTIGSREVKNNSISSKDVRNRTLVNKDFKRGLLKRGAPGARGLTGATGPAGPAGRSALTPLRSGETIRGTWAINAAASSTPAAAISFPVPAPVAVDSAHAVVAGNDVITGDGCSGSAANPVAGPGFACAYAAGTAGTLNSSAGFGARSAAFGDPASTGDGSVNGFMLAFNGTGVFRAHGTWAYRAP